jgi:uncharacterized protein YkwD
MRLAAPRLAASTLALALLALALLALPLLVAGCGSSTPDAPVPLNLPANTYAHGDPSALEQALLEDVQSVRADPAAAGKRLVAMAEVQGAMKQYGVDAQKVIADFAGYAPKPPFAFDPQLAQSSRFHSQDMATKGFQEHDGSAGEGFSDRVTTAGYAWSFVEENIFAYAESVTYCDAAFLIDWGNADLGHRSALLDLDGEARDIGISVIEVQNGPNGVGPLVVTQDFGMPLKDKHRYLVGVAYYDDGGVVGAYDAGEGAGGLRVVPAKGDNYAVTSTSGGYAIPFDPAASLGAFKVQLQSESGEVLAEQTVTLGADNVKLDFKLVRGE